MKTYSVIFTPRAKQHLDNLFGYIAEHSSEARADNYINGIVTKCMALSAFPERGTLRDDIRANLYTMGYARRVTIAFSIDHLGEIVAIHGVFYGGQDFKTLLCDHQNDD